MNSPDDLRRENRALRERLALLSQASLSINESLDFDTVLPGVLDSARSLTGARYGVIALHDEAGNAGDFLSSGMTREEAERVWHQAGWSRPVATALRLTTCCWSPTRRRSSAPRCRRAGAGSRSVGRS